MAEGSFSARVPWRTILVVVLTVALLWLSLRNKNLSEVWRAVLRGNRALIGVAILITLQTYALRARRWQTLLAPIGHARFRTAFRTTVIGFAAIFLLPGRVGEVLRPYLLARQEGLDPAATFATIVIERVLDVVTILLLFACSMPLITVDIGNDVRIAGAIAVSVAIAALVVLFTTSGHPERLGNWAAFLSRPLPARARTVVAKLAHAFAGGLAVMRHPRRLLIVMVWSIALWFSLALQIWITSRAFDLTFSFPGTFLVMMFLAVGVSVPTPGGVGAFQNAYQYAVVHFFAANGDTAAAAANVLWGVSFVPVTLMGLVFLRQDGLSLGRLKGLKATAEAAETS